MSENQIEDGHSVRVVDMVMVSGIFDQLRLITADHVSVKEARDVLHEACRVHRELSEAIEQAIRRVLGDDNIDSVSLMSGPQLRMAGTFRSMLNNQRRSRAATTCERP